MLVGPEVFKGSLASTEETVRRYLISSRLLLASVEVNPMVPSEMIAAKSILAVVLPSPETVMVEVLPKLSAAAGPITSNV